VITDNFLVVLPAFQSRFCSVEFHYPSDHGTPKGSYTSDSGVGMSKAEILEALKAPGVLPPRLLEQLQS